MQPQKLRPRGTGLSTAIWAGQAVIAVLWIVSSLVDGASFWVWPFGFAWAAFGAMMALRSRRRWVLADVDGITVQPGFGRRWSQTWDTIQDVTPDPPGPLVTQMAVVGLDDAVWETPLAKGDPRLVDIWSQRARSSGPKAPAEPT